MNFLLLLSFTFGTLNVCFYKSVVCFLFVGVFVFGWITCSVIIKNAQVLFDFSAVASYS